MAPVPIIGTTITAGHIALVIDSSGCMISGVSGEGGLGRASSTNATAIFGSCSTSISVCLIAPGGFVQRGGMDRLKAALGVVVKDGQLPAFAGGDNQVIASVAIQIKPRHARSKLAEPIGQERLPCEIVKALFVMGMVEHRADILEPGRGRWSGVGDL